MAAVVLFIYGRRVGVTTHLEVKTPAVLSAPFAHLGNTGLTRSRCRILGGPDRTPLVVAADETTASEATAG